MEEREVIKETVTWKTNYSPTLLVSPAHRECHVANSVHGAMVEIGRPSVLALGSMSHFVDPGIRWRNEK